MEDIRHHVGSLTSRTSKDLGFRVKGVGFRVQVSPSTVSGKGSSVNPTFKIEIPHEHTAFT